MELLKVMFSVQQLILFDSNEAKCLIIQKCNFTLRSPKYIINDTDMRITCATYLPKPQASQCSRKEAWKFLSKYVKTLTTLMCLTYLNILCQTILTTMTNNVP